MSERSFADSVGDPSFPYISIWFSRTVGENRFGEWSLARVSVSTKTFHHDLRFRDGRYAKDVLSHQFAKLMNTYLPEDSGPLVFTSNDFVLELPSAIMKGLRVTGQEIRNGVQKVLVTFRFFLGSMTAMFQPGKAPSVLREIECALSTRTITDIILPALSMAVTEPVAAAREHLGASDQLQARWEKLSASHSDLLFYCDLIARFVKAQDRHEPFAAEVGYHASAQDDAKTISESKEFDIDAV